MSGTISPKLSLDLGESFSVSSSLSQTPNSLSRSISRASSPLTTPGDSIDESEKPLPAIPVATASHLQSKQAINLDAVNRKLQAGNKPSLQDLKILSSVIFGIVGDKAKTAAGSVAGAIVGLAKNASKAIQSAAAAIAGAAAGFKAKFAKKPTLSQQLAASRVKEANVEAEVILKELDALDAKRNEHGALSGTDAQMEKYLLERLGQADSYIDIQEGFANTKFTAKAIFDELGMTDAGLAQGAGKTLKSAATAITGLKAKFAKKSNLPQQRAASRVKEANVEAEVILKELNALNGKRDENGSLSPVDAQMEKYLQDRLGKIDSYTDIQEGFANSKLSAKAIFDELGMTDIK